MNVLEINTEMIHDPTQAPACIPALAMPGRGGHTEQRGLIADLRVHLKNTAWQMRFWENGGRGHHLASASGTSACPGLGSPVLASKCFYIGSFKGVV